MKTCMITEETVKNTIRKRDGEIHKGDCGRLLMVAGSEGMMGAAVLTCRSALRSGAGLVQLAVPKALFPVAQVAIPEATCRDRVLSAGDLAVYDAVAIGPGLGTSKESVETVTQILKEYKGKLVLDADSLNLVAAHRELQELLNLRKRSGKGETVITPHVGEAQRLLKGAGLPEGDFRSGQGRLAAATLLAKSMAVTVVLKGMGTLVATEGQTTYINTTGNPGMATGGSGDVLTGILTGIWGQKQLGELSSHTAAICGVYLHGRAGDLAAEKLGEYGLIAGDIAENVPFAIKELF